ncbi:NAD(P)H-binding protein [Geobacter sp. DSM 9736]|uniref:NAD(P)H-binding protein n=1 Tax=Geobacter sp. DSM 9736 TaxID=1277350 RepID=UPI000B508DB2|nr:NAD(P)H-binding protein [Geobacter sp. DSM 9736]SNB47768.1 Uncharacterized conserved protein YbjT, contains NAD(P)-binding and DUF2867 domains [Geobacter sp. DSM 9736]
MAESSGKVLVTGGTGFIGLRLIDELLRRGYQVRSLARHTHPSLPPEVEQVQGDLLEPLTLRETFNSVSAAYYLVHSLAGGRSGFGRRDREAAENFAAAAGRGRVRRVIYLGGLGEADDRLSEHLESRREVADVLRHGSYDATILRAAVIIGAGAASFEIMRSLVERLPVLPAPRWVSTRCQPIAVADVIQYLAGCLGENRTSRGTFDIGGPEVLTYGEMLERLASIEGRPIRIIPLRFLPRHVAAYAAGLFSSIPPSISVPLVEGLKNEVVCRDDRIREILPVTLTPYDDAVRVALAEVGKCATQ